MAIEIPDQLKEVAEQVDRGHERAETVRTLLSWFGFQRRGYSKVRQIRKALRRLKLRTEPDFEGAYVDASVIFLSRLKPGSDETLVDTDAQEEDTSAASAPVTEPVLIASRSPSDPAYRIGRLASANKRPVCVPPDAPVDEAITLMLTNDFSQLPVMTGEREVKGLVSWKSLGSRLALGSACQGVRDCMDCHHEVSADTSLFEVIPLIAQHDCVLVRDSTNKISGIVTAADLSNQFGQLGEPFLLLGAIENHLRSLISEKFTKEELAAVRDPADSGREIEDVADLALGEYLRLVQDTEKWGRLGVKINRKTFSKDLDDIRRIRNDVMHFDPDGVGEDDLAMLRRFVQFLQRLRQLTPKSS